MELEIHEQLRNLINRSNELKINLADLPSIKHNPNIQTKNTKRIFTVFGCLILILAVYVKVYLASDDCLVDMPVELSKAFRPPETCDFCRAITEIKRIEHTTTDEFEKLYAYNGYPIIVTDATVNWTALNVCD